MKKIKWVLVFSLMFTYSLFGQQYTFYDLQSLLNSKYGYTLVIDSNIVDDFVIYGDDLQKDVTLENIKELVIDAGYKYKRKKNFIHITKKSKSEIKALDHRAELREKQMLHEQQLRFKEQEKKFSEDEFFNNGVITDLPNNAVMDICKQMRYECTYISNGAYMVVAKNDAVDISLFEQFTPSDQYALLGTIIELNKNKLRDKNIDINAFVSTLLRSNYIDLNIIGEYGSYFQNSIAADNKIAVSALFRFFENKGIGKITSKPYLILQDKKETKFSTGQSLTVASDIVVNNETGVSQTSYSTVDVGLSITAKPQFSKSYIYVDLNLDISSLLDYDKEKNIANIAKRTLSGTYQLSPNREIKLVGFEQSYKNKKTFKVPILGDLPVLGELFTSNYDDKQNTLLVISFKLIKV